MAEPSVNPPDTIHDVVGVGFGPSNLALAIALREQVGGGDLRLAFLERQRRFGWHRGMLLDGATMQVSFIKDLATPRNPTSDFGFLSYLHQKGRLAAFINHKTFFPSRIEFHDYLDWASERFSGQVRYGHRASNVRPVIDGDAVRYLDVLGEPVGDGPPVVLRTRNLVVAVGLEPLLPAGAESSERVWHSSELLTRLGAHHPDTPLRVVVVGAGQSAAEVTEYLHREYRNAQVFNVFTRYGYGPADDSPFANGIFDPAAVDTFFHAPGSVKEMLLAYHSNTNYSAVDTDLIHELYRRAYQESVRGEHRLHVLNTSKVTAVEAGRSTLTAYIESLATGEVRPLPCDVVVYATGYRARDPLSFLGDVASLCKLDDRGQLSVGRDYRVETTDAVHCGLFVQGGTEDSHGISSSLLSNTAVRAGEIADAIRATLAADGRGAREAVCARA